MVWMLLRWALLQSQSRTVFAAATVRDSPAGTCSSTSDTRRQWAPDHFR